MGRLIDADLLKQCYTGKNSLGTNNNNSKADYASIRKMIDNQPTAYDVDKVVEQLKECERYVYDAVSDEDNYVISTEQAIEIVKGAAKDAERN